VNYEPPKDPAHPALHKLIVSAPFGNYLTFPNCTSTIGTFTAEARPGRLWKVLSTVRYNRRQQSWINKIGLRNPGIRSLKCAGGTNGKIVSIHGFSEADWKFLAICCLKAGYGTVEFNLSCPNVPGVSVAEALPSIGRLFDCGRTVIAKLPPVRWMNYAKPLYAAGVRIFHLCNTIPTPGGGISGKPLMQFSLWAIQDFRDRWGNDVTLIGGGGVTSLADVQTYWDAGADHVAIGSMLFNPLNWRSVRSWTTG
jgi:dihydroorotate dehydrogenase